MEFKTLDEALAHKFVGNHAADAPAFEAIDALIKARLAEVTALSNHITVEGMGMQPAAPEELVFNGAGEFVDVPAKPPAPVVVPHVVRIITPEGNVPYDWYVALTTEQMDELAAVVEKYFGSSGVEFVAQT